MAVFEKVVIIGVGLLGGSFALALREAGLARRIVGVCRSTGTAEQALRLNVVDEAPSSAAEAVVDADLVVLATPMLTLEAILADIAPCLSDTCIVTDVGSVKLPLVNLVQQRYPQLLSRFVFAHPIAGGEKAGVLAARSNLFVGKHLIITEGQLTEPDVLARIQQLWQTIGCQIAVMSAKEHDHVFAYTSHLPHMIAYSLVRNLHHQANHQQLFSLASAGFYDFTRIASSDPIMWRDICLTNRAEILASIDQFQDQLQCLSDAIADGDQKQLETIFADAKKARDEGLIAKQAPAKHADRSV